MVIIHGVHGSNHAPVVRHCGHVGQGGSEILRLACCLATEQGIRVAAPIHDALLVEAPVDEIEHAVSETQAAMREASETVLLGFSLRSDAEIVLLPSPIQDKRGERMWDVVSDLVRGMDG